MASSHRTPAARALAEEALGRLVTHLGPHVPDITVIGGLTPPLLADDSAPEHQGTNDVDLLLQVNLPFDREEQDFAWLEAALDAAHFHEATSSGGGWRWQIDVAGVPVKLELLCDVPGSPPGLVALPGCQAARLPAP